MHIVQIACQRRQPALLRYPSHCLPEEATRITKISQPLPAEGGNAHYWHTKTLLPKPSNATYPSRCQPQEAMRTNNLSQYIYS
jgi:hypothetical protein